MQWNAGQDERRIMLIFAFDAGGDDNTEHLTVAGFASSTEDWSDFSEKWKARLEKDGIPFFRAVDAASFRGPFEHWRELPNREQLRRALFADLMELIKGHAYYKLACTVINKDFRDTSKELRQQFAPRAYSLAARTCEKYARKWMMEEWKSCPELKIGLVFEAGDLGSGKLREQLRADIGHIPLTFLPKKNTKRNDGTIENGFIPLQAADWFAWELNRATRDFYGRLDSESQLRWPMQQFLRHPSGYMGMYSLENLKEMNDAIALQNELVAWEAAASLNSRR